MAIIEYTGVVQSTEVTSGGKRLRVFVAREGRSNDVLLFPAGAALKAGDALTAVRVRPAPETDASGRPLGGIIYWVDEDGAG